MGEEQPVSEDDRACGMPSRALLYLRGATGKPRHNVNRERIEAEPGISCFWWKIGLLQ